MPKLTVADFPEHAARWHPTKNGELKPSEVGFSSHKDIWWTCPDFPDHEFISKPSSKIHQNVRCSCCSGKAVVASTSFAGVYPELATQWHPTLNGDLTPDQVSHKSNKSIYWLCPVANDHVWSASPGTRASHGCPCCDNQKVVKSNCLATTHPALAAEWHEDNDFGTESVVAGSHKKPKWKCDKGHVWNAEVKSRALYGRECPYCDQGGGCRKVTHDNCVAVTHPELLEEFHPVKNGSKTLFDYTKGSKTKIWWKCPAAPDHEWSTSIEKRTSPKQPRKCPCCSGRKVVTSNCLATTHPELAAEWHPENTISPQQLTAGSKISVMWLCSKGHKWTTCPKSRALSGNGCPGCSESKGEKEVARVLEEHGFDFKREHTFVDCKSNGRLRFDFAVFAGEHTLLIEYHGIQHYEPVRFHISHDPHERLAEQKK